MTPAPRTLTAVVVATAVLAGTAWAGDESLTQWTGAKDSKMQAASERAQATLPIFWRVFDKKSGDKGSYYMVKAPFRTAHGGEEHLWMVVLGRRGDQVRGLIANQPDDVPGLHEGDHVVVPTSKISDWSYDKNGREYGAFTMRVMVTRMSKAEVATYAADLSDNPLEPGDR